MFLQRHLLPQNYAVVFCVLLLYTAWPVLRSTATCTAGLGLSNLNYAYKDWINFRTKDLGDMMQNRQGPKKKRVLSNSKLRNTGHPMSSQSYTQFSTWSNGFFSKSNVFIVLMHTLQWPALKVYSNMCYSLRNNKGCICTCNWWEWENSV